MPEGLTRLMILATLGFFFGAAIVGYYGG